VLKDFNKLLNYKLIIINFGINVLSPTYKEYSWYEKKMEKVIQYFKEAFPRTSILLVSVGDKGIKKGSKFITDPQIPMLLEAQKNVAAKTGIAFWDLYQAMGGENSIPQWVNAGPPLAYKDYCHLTNEGGEKVADLLSAALMDEYNKQK
jgi:lysophospholipase L1-like esterase